jgi:hypothetical protein
VRIDAVRKQKVRGAQEVELARAEHVLGFYVLAAPDACATRHHVRVAVHAHEAAVARATQAERPAGAMQFGAARQHQPIGG